MGESFATTLGAARVRAEWAWAAIYAELAPPVLGYLRVRGAPDPEDLLGDVFLRVVKGLSGFDGDERALRRWVLTIAHNLLLDDRRRRARRPVETATPEVLERAGPCGDAEQEGIQAAEIARVLHAIRCLSGDQQDVLLLRLFGELPVDDVAEIVHKSPGAVKALQRRGLAALTKELSRQPVSL